MEARKLIERYAMEAHEENGVFVERHYPSGEARPASGSIYYYLGPGERSVFHQLEFDEYWIYNEGSTLDVWRIDADGRLAVLRCGTEDGAEPMVFFPKGCIFAARHRDPDVADGTFVTCVTVPRFDYSGSRLLGREEVVGICPEAEKFWD